MSLMQKTISPIEGSLYVQREQAEQDQIDTVVQTARKAQTDWLSRPLVELGVACRHYHAASMCVVLTGPQISQRHLEMHATSVVALDAVQSILRPGTTVGEIYDTYQTTLEENGEKDSVLTVCGYTMGAAWPPTWMEQPLIHKGNPVVLEKHAFFYTHDIE